MNPVTDPALLAQLNGNAGVQPQPVNDPKLLSLLNAKPNPNFFQRVGQDYDKRVNMAQTAADAYQRGEQSLPETYMQITGKGVAGLANDVVGEGFKSLGTGLSAITPDMIERPIKETASNAFNFVANSPVGDLAKSGLAKYRDFAEESPRSSRNIEALANIGGYVGALTPVKGQSAVGVAGDVAAPVASRAGRVLAPRNLARGIVARNVDELDAAYQGIRQNSAQAYNRMRELGATFTPDASINIAKNIENTLTKDGILNPRLHDKTLGLLSDFKEVAEKGDLQLESLDQWRQLFGEVARNFNDPVNARKASIVIDAIDDAVGQATAKDLVSGSREAIDALNMGRREYSRARKFEAISDIIRKSDGDANYLKRELKKLADNKKKSSGFTPAEREALKSAATLSTAEGVLKMMGKFGIDLGNSRIGNTGLPVIGGLLTGYGAGPGIGVALPVAGTAARQGQKYIARGKAENLLKTIEKEK